MKGQYSYSPFGEQTKIAGSGPDADFGFAGMYVHARSGLNLTMFRAYSPQLGRWLSRDPLGESVGSNLYAYVRNSPLNAFDPLGLEPQVQVSGNNVTINLPVQFYGPGTQLGVQPDLVQGINSTWTGQFGKYNVTMNAYEAKSGSLTNIYLGGKGNEPSTIVGGDYAVWPLTGIQSQVVNYGHTPGSVAAHEVGHTLGLYDQYVQKGFKHVPKPGHENDIMGGNPNTKPTEEQIDYIIKRWSKPSKCP